jgi:CD80-like C2-set immunoglobulin domain
VPPLYIHIQGLNHPLTSGVKVHLSCSTAGARPVPQIVWTKGTQVMQGASQTVRDFSAWIDFTRESFSIGLNRQTSANGNITTSDIVYLPTPEDNGKVIACSVPVEEKNNAPTLSIKDTRVLDIKRKCRLSGHVNQHVLNPLALLTHRCSHRHTLARLEPRPEEPGQGHRRLLGVPHRSQPSDKEDRMVPQQ